jgi:hypothetical protein
MGGGLFTGVLDALDAERMLRTETGPHLDRRVAGTSTPPSNQQILDAVKASYAAQQPAVDALTTCGVQYVATTDGRATVATLNAYDWKSKQSGPIAPTAQQVYQSSVIAPAVAAAQSDSTVSTIEFGVSVDAQLFLGFEGGIGIAFALDNSGDLVGSAYASGLIGLDVDAAINLALGIWNTSPANLAGDFYGLEVNLDYEVGVSLTVFLLPDLTTFGFEVGVGAGFGGGATLIGGTTAVF